MTGKREGTTHLTRLSFREAPQQQQLLLKGGSMHIAGSGRSSFERECRGSGKGIPVITGVTGPGEEGEGGFPSWIPGEKELGERRSGIPLRGDPLSLLRGHSPAPRDKCPRTKGGLTRAVWGEKGEGGPSLYVKRAILL